MLYQINSNYALETGYVNLDETNKNVGCQCLDILFTKGVSKFCIICQKNVVFLIFPALDQPSVTQGPGSWSPG